jgi:hypothetical protein
VVGSGALNDFNGGGFSYDDGAIGSGKIEFNPFTGFSLTRYDGSGLTGDLTSLNFNSGTTIDIFSNVSGFQGLTYHADYSANYTNRSLVDKGYVDTVAPPSWRLSNGGTLTGANTITQGSNLITLAHTGTGSSGNLLLTRTATFNNPGAYNLRTQSAITNGNTGTSFFSISVSDTYTAGHFSGQYTAFINASNVAAGTLTMVNPQRSINLSPTYTSSSGSFSTVIGIDYNPNIGSATITNHIAARFITGTFLMGSTITAGSVLADFQSTTLGVVMPRVTNIASIVTPVAGMIAYDAATNKFNFRENAAWVQLGGGGGGISGLTSGRVPFATSGTTIGDDADLTWDNATNKLSSTNIVLPQTTNSNTGVIFKGTDRFFHNFALTGTDGNNTFLGRNAGNFTMTGSTGQQGSYNLGFGDNVLSLNSVGNFNTGVGINALSSNGAGAQNTAVGGTALSSNVGGSGNTAIGIAAGSSIVNGNFNTFIGRYSGFNVSQSDVSNSIAIGNDTFTTANNQIVIGNASNIETILRGSVAINGSASPNASTALDIQGTTKALKIGSATRASISTPLSGHITNDTNVPYFHNGTAWRAIPTSPTALGTSLQVLRTNAAGTATEWATISGGGGGGVTVIAGSANLDYDFSTSGEGDYATVTIADSILTNTNFTSFSYLPVANSSHDLIDFVIEGLNFKISNIIDNTSFDIVSTCKNNTFGIYNISYKIIYS